MPNLYINGNRTGFNRVIITRLSKHPPRPKGYSPYFLSYPSAGYITAILVTGLVYSPTNVLNFTFLTRPSCSG